MDYTTLARVKASLGTATTQDDSLLAEKITAASREIDRFCSGVVSGSDNYFLLADVVDEQTRGWVQNNGRLACYPRKPAVNSVASLAYRAGPFASWVSVDTAQYVAFSGPTVEAWVDLRNLRGDPLQVQISYNGGYSAAADTLPLDLVEAATVLAIRFYREAKTGLTDSVGVAELGMLTYTKAIPIRVEKTLMRYQRIVPW